MDASFSIFKSSPVQAVALKICKARKMDSRMRLQLAFSEQAFSLNLIVYRKIVSLMRCPFVKKYKSMSLVADNGRLIMRLRVAFSAFYFDRYRMFVLAREAKTISNYNFRSFKGDAIDTGLQPNFEFK